MGLTLSLQFRSLFCCPVLPSNRYRQTNGRYGRRQRCTAGSLSFFFSSSLSLSKKLIFSFNWILKRLANALGQANVRPPLQQQRASRANGLEIERERTTMTMTTKRTIQTWIRLLKRMKTTTTMPRRTMTPAGTRTVKAKAGGRSWYAFALALYGTHIDREILKKN